LKPLTKISGQEQLFKQFTVDVESMVYIISLNNTQSYKRTLNDYSVYPPNYGITLKITMPNRILRSRYRQQQLMVHP